MNENDQDPVLAAALPIMAKAVRRFAEVGEATRLETVLIDEDMDPAQAIRMLVDVTGRQAQVYVEALGEVELAVRTLYLRLGLEYAPRTME